LIGKSKVSDYTLPFISSENSGGVSSNHVTTLDGGDLIVYIIADVNYDLVDSDDDTSDSD
jgi:hypothetical protein